MSNYSVYILRIWVNKKQARFRIENSRTAEVFLFKTLEEMVVFLSQENNLGTVGLCSNTGECDDKQSI